MGGIRITKSALDSKVRWEEIFKAVKKSIPDFGPHSEEEGREILLGAMRGGEIVPEIPPRTGVEISRRQIEEWWEGRVKAQTVVLERGDYLKCLLFAVRAFYKETGMTITHFGRREQRRELGQWLSNQTEGKLGEIAVQKFLWERGVRVDLDWTLRGKPRNYLPDITKVWGRPPRLRVSIKTTKFRGVWLDLPRREVDREEKGVDGAIMVRVGLPEDHLFRVLKEISALLKLLASFLGVSEDDLQKRFQEPRISQVDEIREIWEEVPTLGTINTYVVGFTFKEDLQRHLVKKDERVRWIGVMEEDKYVMKSGELRYGKEWEKLVSAL